MGIGLTGRGSWNVRVLGYYSPVAKTTVANGSKQVINGQFWAPTVWKIIQPGHREKRVEKSQDEVLASSQRLTGKPAQPRGLLLPSIPAWKSASNHVFDNPVVAFPSPGAAHIDAPQPAPPAGVGAADAPGRLGAAAARGDGTRLQASRGLIAHKIKPSNTKMLF